MEKDMVDVTPRSETNEVAAVEANYSNTSILLSPQLNNHPCDGSMGASSAQKYIGVVQQPNGYWDALIYGNCLGTFKSEEEAAMAYDSAAILLRIRACHCNLLSNHNAVEECEFQSRHTVQYVLTMIRDGTYRDKLSKYLSARTSVVLENGLVFPSFVMFQKKLSPSDVGKIDRLILPRKSVIKFFPRICPSILEMIATGEDFGIELEFYDREMISWKFRFSWFGNQAMYMFQGGWKRFVKEKGLRSGDVVVFHECSYNDRKNFYTIDVLKSEVKKTKVECLDKDVAVGDGEKQQPGFKLFGVDIMQEGT